MTARERHALQRLVDKARREQIAAARRESARLIAGYRADEAARCEARAARRAARGDHRPARREDPLIEQLGRCVYCGAIRSVYALACIKHRDLLDLDPAYVGVVTTRRRGEPVRLGDPIETMAAAA